MTIKYSPLFATLHDREKRITEMISDIPLSSRTVAKLRKDEPVSLATINKICDYLHCNIEDVLKHVKK